MRMSGESTLMTGVIYLKKNYHDVINHIDAVTDTGLEAVDHLVSLKSKPMDTSFAFALEILEMLSEVQETVVSLQGLSWSGEVRVSLETIIGVFGQLADAYEAENAEAYMDLIDEINKQYNLFHASLSQAGFQA